MKIFTLKPNDFQTQAKIWGSSADWKHILLLMRGIYEELEAFLPLYTKHQQMTYLVQNTEGAISDECFNDL